MTCSMASGSVTMISAPVAAGKREMHQEQNGLRRSQSGKDLSRGAAFRRSYSDNHLCYSINSIRASSARSKLKHSRSTGIIPFQLSSSIIPNSLRSFLFDSETSKELNVVEPDMKLEDTADEVDGGEMEIKRSNWVERLLEIRSHWRNKHQINGLDGDNSSEMVENGDTSCTDNKVGCEAGYSSEEEDEEEDDDEVKYDQESFSKLLVQVPTSDIKLFSQLAFLCNMAYVIPTITAEDLRKQYRLHLVTSSIERKAEMSAIKAKFNEDSIRVPVVSVATTDSCHSEKDFKHPIRPSVAYDIAASAASYVQSRAKELPPVGSETQEEENDINPFGSREGTQEEADNSPRFCKSEVAVYMAASAMTSVVAAGEKEKQEAARDLQSLHSSPCEWFICDDLSTYTRCFVIQGSDSLASWQANLFFDPTKFEETEGIVHRGIYEAAKGMYQQFMPEILDHLNKFGDRAKFQFTGHSLGGSLALLVHLMLISRNILKPANLRPVVTFGSPFVFCGGKKILNQLGLDENIVQCIMMHRDIVPRAFSCSYPSQVAVLLKRLPGSFRSHPCLIKNKLLYSPLGKMFILQPDEKSSPPHPLLPPESALYSLDKDRSRYSKNAVRAFLNCPHPLDTLSDPSAYGSEGTILRDHDSSNYLKAINGVLRQHTKIADKRVRVLTTRNQMWPLLTSPSPHLWRYQSYFESNRYPSKEVLTGV
ncbi:phospholipase A1 PLIP1, chloroplastic [Rhodamnia argentea]|uniref:Phospholipase A1 PLIP1, chloroplastic n=1 Tax=Rhodamnia argentea TaxID=178133 RepID=A0A8B8Q3P7_9MYRT|nr:phospholipase A1 PLIP1, chloroplastic [Rhodamnia argentea]XP_048140709.1 phospholipase A1 PLIP1, chloroplastic [Rhodamnia argentea]